MENLHSAPPDAPTDFSLLLPREAFQEILRTLRGCLPPPEGELAEDWERRDRAALAKAAALRPETAAEGEVAAQFVAAAAWAMDCLRQAVERRLEFNVARKCQAQAASLMRESKSALRLLLKLQAERSAFATDTEAADRAAWAEHAAFGMMEGGLRAPPREASAAVSGSDPGGEDAGHADGEAVFDEIMRTGSEYGIEVLEKIGETGMRYSGLAIGGCLPPAPGASARWGGETEPGCFALGPPPGASGCGGGEAMAWRRAGRG